LSFGNGNAAGSLETTARGLIFEFNMAEARLDFVGCT